MRLLVSACVRRLAAIALADLSSSSVGSARQQRSKAVGQRGMATEGLSRAFWVRNQVVPTEAKLLRVGGAEVSGGGQVAEVRVATWNLLAPAYARGLERELWRDRLERQQAQLAAEACDVIALQEFWVTHEPSFEAWDAWAKRHDYSLFVLARTRGKADGCATLVKSRLVGGDAFGVHYDDWGDRVCLFVPLGDDLVACNTHWTFAHDNAWDPIMRLHQARKISEFVAATFPDKRVCLVGDLNGDLVDPAVAKLATDGWTLHHPPGSWVSHRAHTGAFLACDFVATRNLPHVNDCRVHGDRSDLFLRDPPDFRVSDHNMVTATLDAS